MDHCIQGFEKFQKNTSSIFFDRGMPDLIHYANRFDVDQTEFVRASKQYLYNVDVFIFPPWEQIFVNDSVSNKF
jgi:predicted ATPase